MNIEKLDKLFTRYGYELNIHNDQYRVYLSHRGMYYGAEIIKIQEFNEEELLNKFSKLGYASKAHNFKTVIDAENYLFKGFFKTDFTESNINRRYNEFANKQIKHYGDPNIKYEYINVPYTQYTNSLNEYKEKGDKTLIETINEIISKDGAKLIIVEAAAGFGKTCTVFELYKSFLDLKDRTKPLFTELSRNREARRFKYVLWSEIDAEYNQSINTELVIYNIKNGKIPLIIDGFDELLSKDIDSGKKGNLNEFEQVETMLSTIGDLLTDNAKIILTSRRTAIFAGEEFGKWIDSYENVFDVIRFQLDSPNITHWLNSDRFELINKNKIPLSHINNPVLLTYLRNLNDEDFNKLLETPEIITDKYFEYLLNREKERQDLVIPYKDQMNIFENLAKSFVDFNITYEIRSFVKDLIIDQNKEKLNYFRELSPTPQGIDELAETLTNHALLDRISNKDYIGFINEFIFGYLLSKVILQKGLNAFENINEQEDFLLQAISSFKYASKDERYRLWKEINYYRDILSLECIVFLDSFLLNKMTGTYESKGLSSHNFENVNFLSSDCLFKIVAFTDSKFINCRFDIKAFENCTFTGCKFFDCSIIEIEENITEISMFCYGCEDNNDFIKKIKSHIHIAQEEEEKVIDYDIIILSKYFKVDGKTPKMVYISRLRDEFSSEEQNIVFVIFDKLKSKNFIKTQGNNSYITSTGINYYHKIKK